MKGIRQTIFSADRQYRYTLWREWDLFLPGYAMFIGLNPSVADETKDDPTIRRCVAFAKAWGYGALVMTNLFAFRATDPRAMQAQVDPIGAENDHWLRQCAEDAAVIVAAWGTRAAHRGRGLAVARLLLEYPLMCLDVTVSGHPRHPLYVSGRVVPSRWPLRER